MNHCIVENRSLQPDSSKTGKLIRKVHTINTKPGNSCNNKELLTKFKVEYNTNNKFFFCKE